MSFKSALRLIPGWREPREAAMGFLGASYLGRILATDPIALWALPEHAGVNAADEIDSPAQDGTYSNVNLNLCDEIPYFIEASDGHVDVFSAALQAAWNGAEGSALIVFKPGHVFGGSVWTDGQTRYLYYVGADADNHVYIRKDNVNNRLTFTRRAGGFSSTVFDLTIGVNEAWHAAIITWSESAGGAGEVKVFSGGVQIGATQVGLGAWVGNLFNTLCVIGAEDTTPANPWDGYEKFMTLWDRPLDDAAAMELTAIADADVRGGQETCNESGANAFQGTHTEVCLDGSSAETDGVASFTDVYSAAFAAAWSGSEFTAIARAQIRDAAQWTAGGDDKIIRMGQDNNNDFVIRRSAANQVSWEYTAGGVGLSGIPAWRSSTATFTVGSTVSASADEFRSFWDGVQEGAPIGGLGVYVGNLSDDQAAISWGATGWNGWIYDVVYGIGQVATPAEVTTLHNHLMAGTLTAGILNGIFGVGNWAWYNFLSDRMGV